MRIIYDTILTSGFTSGTTPGSTHRARLMIVCLIGTLLATVSSTHAAGLLAPTDRALPPLRVTDHLVEARIDDGIALTTVTQTFRNDTRRRLEATYVFPLPEDADLTDFQMSFNGAMVKGRVLPAEEAAHIYESIVRQAKDPGLVEFIGRRLLQMRVFPIEPESNTTIQLQYQQICRPVSGMQAYHYPLRTRKTAGQAYGTVRFSVRLNTGAALKNIWSPTHSVEIVRDANERSARIAYEATGGSLEDDFLLLYGTDDSDVGLSVVAHKPAVDAFGHFVLMLTPRQLWPESEYQPQDIVFVVDTSGSMAGDKLTQAKSSLRYCIERLDDRDRFSVVRFSTGFDALFDTPQIADADRRAKAREWIDDFGAGGGTNIADTLRHVVGMRRASASVDDAVAPRPFVVVFLTDGRGNRTPAEIVNLLDEAAKDGVRMFPFGVGHDVNTILLDRLADRFAGTTRYVQPGESLELVLGDFFSVISRPVLTDLRLTLPAIGATERFPATLGDLYHGQQITLAGRFRDMARGPVVLTANRGGERVEFVWRDVDFTNTANAAYVPTVWAGRKIAYLVDQIRTHGESSEMIGEILALSQEHGIQTPYSSWLVDPERRGGLVPPPPVRPSMPPGRPGVWGGSAGGATGTPAFTRAVRDRLGAASGNAGAFAPEPAPEGVAYGDDFDELDLAVAQKSVTEAHGRVANMIARKNAELKMRRSGDAGRLDQNALAHRRIGARWYHRMGRYLVDDAIGEDTEIVVVRFASDAYFQLVKARPELRPVMAASTTVVIMMPNGVAVLVSDTSGLETLTDVERRQLGLE